MHGAKLFYFGFALDAPDLGERQSYDRAELRVLRAVEVAFDIVKLSRERNRDRLRTTNPLNIRKLPRPNLIGDETG